MASRHDVASRRKAGTGVGPGYVFEALEPRILLSADPLGVAVGDALHGGLDDRLPEELRAAETFDALIAPSAATLLTGDTTASDPSPALPAPVDLEGLALLHGSRDAADESRQAASREILFVDAGVDDYRQLVDELAGGDSRVFEVVVLDAERDGIAQITEVLADRDRIDAVHILSHGTEGGIRLGDGWLTGGSLSAYADEMAGWGAALTEEADLLFYGCNLAGSEEGRDLVDRLSALTGADTAASVNATGSTELNGDWDLEYATGGIEAPVAFSEELQQSWMGLLPMVTFQEGTSGYTGTQDTFLDSGNITADNGVNGVLEVASTGLQGLIRFDNIFGSGPGQIPVGSTINSASLSMDVTDPSAPGASIELHRMLVSWTESDTWTNGERGCKRAARRRLQLTASS